MLTPTLRLPTITQELALNTIRYNRNLSAVETRMSRIGKSMSDIGIGLSLAVSIPLQLMTISAVKSYAALENAATRAASRIQDSSSATVASIMASANAISRRVPLPQTDIAKGMEEIVKVGGNLAFSMRAVEIASKFAVAGGTNLEDSIGKLTGTMFAFNLQTGNMTQDLMQLQRVSDVIAFAADATKASYTGMTQAFENAAPAAKTLGISLEQTAAILATMSQAMIEGGKAGTYFQMITRYLTQSFEKHSAAWKKFGINIYDGSHNLRKMADIIGELQGKLSKMSDQGKIETLMGLGINARSQQGISALFGLTDQAKALEAQLRTAGGYVESVFSKQMESFEQQCALLSNRLTEVKVAAGAAMVSGLQTVNVVLTNLLDRFLALSPAQQANIMKWVTIVAVAAPAIVIFATIARSMEALVVMTYRLIESLVVLSVQILVTTVGAAVSLIGTILSLNRAIIVSVLSMAGYNTSFMQVLPTYQLFATMIGSVMVPAIGRMINAIMLAPMAFVSFITLMYQASTNIGMLVGKFGLFKGVLLTIVRMLSTLINVPIIGWFAQVGISAIAMGLQFLYSVGQVGLLTTVMNGLRAGLALVSLANIRVAVTAVAAWLGQLGPIALVIAAIALVGFGLYKLVGGWEGMKKAGTSVAETIGSVFDFIFSGIEKRIGKMTGDLTAFGESMLVLKNPGGPMLTMKDPYNQAFPNYQKAIKTWQDITALPFDSKGKLQLNPGMQTSGLYPGTPQVEGTDPGLTPDKKDKTVTASHPFSAKEFGSEEEYRARVGGQNQLVKTTDKILAEHKKTSKNTEKTATGVEGIKTVLQNRKTVEIMEAGIT